MSVAPLPRSGRFTFVIVLTLTLLVFAAVVAFVTRQLRQGLRDQILAHEGESVAAVATMQLANSAERLAKLGLTDAPGELLEAVLQTSKLSGVFAIRMFERDRSYGGALGPWVSPEENPRDEDWAQLMAGRPLARLHAQETLTFLDRRVAGGSPGGATVPVLEVWVPLRRAAVEPIKGAAQFWIDGQGLADEFAALDRRLWVQAGLAWLAGAVVIGVALAWAFRRLDAANRELLLRGEDLERANRELVLAAKTSALGAVTAHLIHEIKNPVAGLEVFVASQAESGGNAESGAELAAASELTRRLRTMINDVVAVLRDEQTGTNFELTGAEISEIALAKAQAVAQRRGIRLVADVGHTGSLSGRRANLASLVLQNLLQNAAEAAPSESQVRLGSRPMADGGVEFVVEDNGPGLPDSVRARLFQPCASSKPGGSGLGLALSHQLAQQAGGRLELLRSDERGTCFRFILPLER